MIVNRFELVSNNKQQIDISEANTSVSSCSYSGTSISLSSLLSVISKGTTLVYGRDYELTGQDTAINAGTYTAQIVGIGRCIGTKSISWTIDKKHITSWTLNASRTKIPPYTSSEVYVAFTATLSTPANEPLELVNSAFNFIRKGNGGSNVKSTSNPQRSYYLKAASNPNPKYIFAQFYLNSANYNSTYQTVYFTVSS